MNKKMRIIKSTSEILLWLAEYLIIALIFFGLGFYVGVKADIKHAYAVHYVYTEEARKKMAEKKYKRLCIVRVEDGKIFIIEI